MIHSLMKVGSTIMIGFIGFPELVILGGFSLGVILLVIIIKKKT